MGTFASSRHPPGGQRGQDRGRSRRASSCSSSRRRSSRSSVADLVLDGKGSVSVAGSPDKSLRHRGPRVARPVPVRAHDRRAAGVWMKPKSEVDPDTGRDGPRLDPGLRVHRRGGRGRHRDRRRDRALGSGRAYEVGRQMNPALVQGQITRRGLDGPCRTRCTRPPSRTTRSATTARTTSAST